MLSSVANTCLLPFHMVMSTLVWNMRSHCFHFDSLSQLLCGLVSGFDFMMLHKVGNMDAWTKSHSRSGSAVSLHIHEPGNVRR